MPETYKCPVCGVDMPRSPRIGSTIDGTYYVCTKDGEFYFTHERPYAPASLKIDFWFLHKHCIIREAIGQDIDQWHEVNTDGSYRCRGEKRMFGRSFKQPEIDALHELQEVLRCR